MLPDPAAPASSRELTRYTEERKGSRGIKHAFNALSLAKRLSGEGLGAAKRNLMAVLGAPIRQQWLASASARFQDKYGARLSCSKEAGLATFVDIESNKASAWGPANEWADVKLRFQGQLQITPDGAESAAQPLPFHASVHIRVKWDELAQPDFRFESRHVRRFEENLGRLAKPALPKFPWAD
jgi:hypothetical protein